MWRKDKPFGFHARPETAEDGCAGTVWDKEGERTFQRMHADGRQPVLCPAQKQCRRQPARSHYPPCRSINLMRWKCHIPGKEATEWEGGFFPITMEFSEDYPTKPPKVSHGVAGYAACRAGRRLVAFQDALQGASTRAAHILT